LGKGENTCVITGGWGGVGKKEILGERKKQRQKSTLREWTGWKHRATSCALNFRVNFGAPDMNWKGWL